MGNSDLKKGLIVKLVRGIYYVEMDGRRIRCKARGQFRKTEETPIVGDYVGIRITKEDYNGYIEYIYPRKNILLRPPVANIDQAVIVISIIEPNINLLLLDKYLVMLEDRGIQPVIVVSKIDLIDEETMERFIKKYHDIGYIIIPTSSVSNKGFDHLESVLKNKITALVGPSGVGKSTILNKVSPGLSLETGMISEKSKRGKHTTRHVELFEIFKDSFIFDTPGFSSLDISYLDRNDAKKLFPEFVRFSIDCRFQNCMHINEPECNVKDQMEKGIIQKSRYENYLLILDEIDRNRRY